MEKNYTNLEQKIKDISGEGYPKSSFLFLKTFTNICATEEKIVIHFKISITVYKPKMFY